MITINDLLNRLKGVRRTAHGATAKCPAHEDDNPSLSIGTGDGGKLLVKCHAGCSTTDVLEAVDLKMSDLFPADESGFAARFSETYDYRDEEGTLLFQAVRLKSPKTFRQRRPDGAGNWSWTLGDVRRVLYRLPELLASPADTRVFIVEGEKDVERLAQLNVLATTNPMGAGKWEHVDDEPLRGRQVVILPDNDDAGTVHADDVARALLDKATETRVLRLPDLPEKGDVSDWIASGGTAEALVKLASTAPLYIPDETNDCSGTALLPEVILPGQSIRIIDAAEQLGQMLATGGRYYWRGGGVVTVTHDIHDIPRLETVKPAALASVFETVATLKRQKPANGGGYQTVPTICTEQTAKMMMIADQFAEQLPSITVVAPCTVLADRRGELVHITGYDPESGIMTTGVPIPEISLVEAGRRIDELFYDFQFATPADRSRAMSGLITPALVFGGILGGRAPIDLGEADASQSGKGFRNKLTAAVYSQTVSTVTQRRGGVGSLDESFNSALIQGANFIALDNVRGRVDSPSIESFLTEDQYLARVPYQQSVQIDPHRVILQLTSNKADITPDLANRSCCVRIIKHPPGYTFRQFPEGDILDRVRRDPTYYLAAVFAIVKQWHQRGKPQTSETRHDFRVWCRTLDWIVQNLLDAVPLMDGHRETQARMTNPAMNWLRDIALCLVRAGRQNQWLRTYQILDCIADAPNVEVPGVKEDSGLAEVDDHAKLLRAVGRRLSKCFADDIVMIDHLTVERRQASDTEYRTVPEYRVTMKTEVVEI